MTTTTTDPVTRYGFTRTAPGKVTCDDCTTTLPAAGDVMRSHRRRCTGIDHPTPGVCFA